LKLDYAILLAQDLAAMRRFYVDVLGLPVRSERPGWIELGDGPAVLALRPRDRSYDGAAGAGAGAQLAFRVPLEEVERHESALRAQAVEIVERVTRNDASGHTTLFLLDPERNVVELYAEHQAPAGSLATGAPGTTA
jgi:catechol 2,3-dioxygenase-like lactoylglutathione lyase family enzyme